jgi:hypothetical protein
MGSQGGSEFLKRDENKLLNSSKVLDTGVEAWS